MTTLGQWPDQMPILDASDFNHDLWENSCGTQRCMVGWVGSVFYANALIAEERFELSKPCKDFLLKLAENMGEPFYSTKALMTNSGNESISLMEHVSDVFEGKLLVKYPPPPLSEKRAAEIWNSTIRFFGYTEEFEYYE